MEKLQIPVKDIGEVSDGYHTFSELYEHRITLFIALCRVGYSIGRATIWRSRKHSDGEICFGTGTQFLLGINKGKGKQITYHIPIEKWDKTDFAETLDKAPEFDGHTSEDVLKRLNEIN